MRHHRPKPRRLRADENRRAVAYHNRITGWYRIGDRMVHGEVPIADVLRDFLRRGIDIRFHLIKRERRP